MDIQYQRSNYLLSELEHKYSKNVHVLNSPVLLSMLGKLCRQETVQPEVNLLTHMIYSKLMTEVINNEFDQKEISFKTRMSASHPDKANCKGSYLDFNSRVVSVSLARAGILPSQVCYEQCNYLFDPSNVRQDHFYVSRTVNDKGQVTGSDITGSKIGGGIKDCYVLIPDPMAATGSTILEVLNHYKKIEGPAKKFIAVHLIITPEYIKKITHEHPDCVIYSIRLDRGFSSDKVLKSVPGTFVTEEIGLNDHQYIVPGGGGLGEVLNNSFV